MTEVGAVYGQALYDLALSEGIAKAVLDEMVVLEHCFTVEEPEFLRLLSTPNLTKQERCHILDESFRGKIQPYLLNFMKILTEKGYIRHFSDCCTAYREQYYKDNDILLVKAVTAVPMTPEQLQKLTQKLMTITGKQIELRNRVDPECLGGVRLDFDGKRLDDTVAHRLDAIRGVLKNTVL
jgi:F-type H+-transporting ATPase subunit delta